MLLVRLRRDADAPKDVTIGMSCGAGCGGTLPFADTLAGIPAGKFQTVGIPLKCFAEEGEGRCDQGQRSARDHFASPGKLDIALSQVKLGTVADKTMTCN